MVSLTFIIEEALLRCFAETCHISIHYCDIEICFSRAIEMISASRIVCLTHDAFITLKKAIELDVTAVTEQSRYRTLEY
jgi:hypothetical protein